jgi:hypothetical protein
VSVTVCLDPKRQASQLRVREQLPPTFEVECRLAFGGGRVGSSAAWGKCILGRLTRQVREPPPPGDMILIRSLGFSSNPAGLIMGIMGPVLFTR